MKQRTSEEIAQIFKIAGDSVTLINTETSKYSYETVDDWKDRIKRNVEHLETIKAYKKEDDTTSIWTSESFTDIDAAIVKGKTIYGG
tara:strand:- start:2125 stop:2385 length:261 start_codon:yes stop_codon:yes gene_type:complete